MQIESLEFMDVLLVNTEVYEDFRGYFFESFNTDQYGINIDFVQDNVSYSKQGTLRGLHYQLDPHAQGKFTRVLKGKVFDVAVDIKPDSPTFGKWVGVVLSDENHYGLYVPPGYAHGFVVLSDEAIFSYKVTNYYHPGSDRSIRWDDSDIGIEWPIKPQLISDKDANAQTLSEAKKELS